MTYKAVIFDLDGTLLDTIGDLADSMNIVLKQHNFPTHDLNTYKTLVGNGIKTLVKLALPSEHKDESSVVHYNSLMQNEYAKRWNNRTKPYEGIERVIETLGSKDIKLAVLSNKTHEFTRKMISHYFGLEKFQIVIGDREGKPLKPDPTSAIEISTFMDILPEQIAYLGDSGVDMQTAVNAGMFSIGATWGFRSKKELQENGADALINSPEELLNFF